MGAVHSQFASGVAPAAQAIGPRRGLSVSTSQPAPAVPTGARRCPGQSSGAATKQKSVPASVGVAKPAGAGKKAGKQAGKQAGKAGVGSVA